jgi:hypothetical protein
MDYLVETLPASHPLFIQRVWTSGIMNRLKDKILSGCGRNDKSKMFATGIPPHILLANELIKLESKLENLKTEVITYNNVVLLLLLLIIIIINIIIIIIIIISFTFYFLYNT